ncbi:MAG: RNA polymerase sigma factor [Kiritimatiellae bacterium]|nr:RNA polymerase sigma factor [Kiritimatiellia bacterium]
MTNAGPPIEPDGAAETVATLYRECRAELELFFRRRHADTAAEDLVQETFARLVRSARALLAARSPRAFVFGIARHVSLDAWRRAAVRSVVAFEPEPRAEVAAPAPDVRRAAALRDAISTLPPTDQEILDLRFQHDLSYAEIAEALRIPLGTVRSRLHHALRRLRAVWDEHTAAPPEGNV